MSKLLVLEKHKLMRFQCLKQTFEALLPKVMMSFSEDSLLLDKKDISDLEKLLLELPSYQVFNILAHKLTEVFKQKFLADFWMVYITLLDEQKLVNSVFDYEIKFEQERINSAIRNAFFVFFGLADVIPKTYYRKFIREPGNEEYKSLFKSSLPLAYRLSRFHFDKFRAFIYATTRIDRGLGNKLHYFYAKHFDFVENNGELTLVLSDLAERRMQKEIDRMTRTDRANFDEATLGCPAGFAKDPSDNQDLIKILFDWTYRVMERFYFV